MKKQKIALILSIFLVVTLVTAQAIGNIIDADFTSSSIPEKIRYAGNITFLADEKEGRCELDEPNLDIDDDFEECLAKNYPNMKITNIVDWERRKYKQITINDVTYRSFNQTKLEDIKDKYIEVNPV